MSATHRRAGSAAQRPNPAAAQLIGAAPALRARCDRGHPLHDIDTDCGATSLAEAMAMAKPVVITRTRGQVDIMRDREHGIQVPPGDPRALREAIVHLLRHPDEARAMGAAGRAHVIAHHSLDGYITRLARLIRGEEG